MLILLFFADVAVYSCIHLFIRTFTNPFIQAAASLSNRLKKVARCKQIQRCGTVQVTGTPLSSVWVGIRRSVVQSKAFEVSRVITGGWSSEAAAIANVNVGSTAKQLPAVWRGNTTSVTEAWAETQCKEKDGTENENEEGFFSCEHEEKQQQPFRPATNCKY